MTTKIRSDDLELLRRTCVVLMQKAELGLPIPVKVELGTVHVLGQAVRRLAKDVGAS